LGAKAGKAAMIGFRPVKTWNRKFQHFFMDITLAHKPDRLERFYFLVGNVAVQDGGKIVSFIRIVERRPIELVVNDEGEGEAVSINDGGGKVGSCRVVKNEVRSKA
jgi:hypothetical protein